MKTAVEWYAELEVKLTLDFISNKLNELEYGIKRIKLIEQAKEIEKEQIMNAMDWIMNKYFEFHEQPTTSAREQYYNETFKSE